MKIKRGRFFLETSAVYYQLLGHTLQKSAVQSAVGAGFAEVSNFIRMEYLHGLIINLIDLYYLIKEWSVSDALIEWSQKVKQDRKLKDVLMTICQWLPGHEDWKVREKSLRRLGDLIVRLVYEFDDVYRARCPDQLACELGHVSFRRQTFDEGMLLDFYERFKNIEDGIPNCRLCEFKIRQRRMLENTHTDLYSLAKREAYSKNKGYVAQAERMEKAAKHEGTTPRCSWCTLLGDTIIALHAPRKASIVTADRAFVALGEILGRQVVLLPSLQKLKKQMIQTNPAVPRQSSKPPTSSKSP